MRSLVGPMCGEIEQAADQIITGATNDAVKRAALQWKIEGVPAVREALFVALVAAFFVLKRSGPGRATTS